MKKSTFYRFSGPSNASILLLMLIPLMVAVYLSFHFVTFRNINQPQWVGWRNYVDILTDAVFWRSMRMSLLIVLVTVPVQIMLGFFVALLLDQVRTGWRAIYLTMILLPFIVVPVVGTLMFKQMFETGGLIAYLYRILFDRPFVFTAVSVKALILIQLIWQVTPYPIVMFFAGLQGLPKEQISAAEVDGANLWQLLTMVVIPHLRPLMLVTVMMLMMDMYRMFDSVMVMTEMNPVFQAENAMVYGFRVGMEVQRLGMANAISLLTVLGVMIILIPFLRMSYKNQLEGN